jgi:hypothetical protein
VSPLAAWLDEIEARAAKATPGPWYVGKGTVYHKRAREGEEPLEIEVAATEGAFWDEDPDDTAFIASSRSDVPALVALLRLAVSVVDAARDLADTCEDDDWISVTALLRSLARFDAAVAALSQPAAEEGPR